MYDKNKQQAPYFFRKNTNEGSKTNSTNIDILNKALICSNIRCNGYGTNINNKQHVPVVQ